jgi:hypothetical protein
MTISYQQTREDVMAATRLLCTRLKYFLLGCWVLVLMIAIPSIREAIKAGALSTPGIIQNMVAIFPFMFLSLFLLFLYWLQPRLAARRTILRAVEWNLSDSGVHLKSEVSSAEIQWPAFIKFREDKKILLMYVQKGQAQFIPKRVLGESQLDELRALVSAHVPKA